MGGKSSKLESKADIARAIKNSGLIPINHPSSPSSPTAQVAPFEDPDNPINNAPINPSGTQRADSGLQLGMVLGGKWQLIDRVGRGAFGDIFLADFVGSSTTLPRELFRCALKVEKLEVADEATVKLALKHEADMKQKQLKFEAEKRGETFNPDALQQINEAAQPVANAVYMKRCIVKLEAVILSKLQECDAVSRFIEYGRDTQLQVAYLAMELLGENLLKLRRERRKMRFSLSTSLRFGILALKALQHMHDAGFVHRDVKPSNFVIGTGNKTDHIYLIDFGLSRCFVDRLTGEVLDSRPDIGGFRGTPRYASINVHRELDLSRRDDLWSWFYILLEFITGDLPWGSKRDKASIGQIKEKYHEASKLTKNCPSCFVVIFNHLNSLEFKERPNYDLLLNLLHGKLNKLKIKLDEPFDWEDPLMKQAINQSINSATTLADEVQARWSLNDAAAATKHTIKQAHSEESKEEVGHIGRGPSMTIVVHTDETNQPLHHTSNNSFNQSTATRGSTVSTTCVRARSGSTQNDENEHVILTPQPDMKRSFSSPSNNQSTSQYIQSPSPMSPSVNLTCSSPNPLWSRNPMSTRYDGAEAASPMFSVAPLAAPPSTPQPVSPQPPHSPALKPQYQVQPRETIKQTILNSQSPIQTLAHDHKPAPQLSLNNNALSLRRKLQSLHQSNNQPNEHQQQ